MFFASSVRVSAIPLQFGYICAAVIATVGTLVLGILSKIALAPVGVAQWLK